MRSRSVYNVLSHDIWWLIQQSIYLQLFSVVRLWLLFLKSDWSLFTELWLMPQIWLVIAYWIMINSRKSDWLLYTAGNTTDQIAGNSL